MILAVEQMFYGVWCHSWLMCTLYVCIAGKNDDHSEYCNSKKRKNYSFGIPKIMIADIVVKLWKDNYRFRSGRVRVRDRVRVRYNWSPIWTRSPIWTYQFWRLLNSDRRSEPNTVQNKMHQTFSAAPDPAGNGDLTTHSRMGGGYPWGMGLGYPLPHLFPWRPRCLDLSPLLHTSTLTTAHRSEYFNSNFTAD